MNDTLKTNCQTPQRQGLSGHIELPTMPNGLDIQDLLCRIQEMQHWFAAGDSIPEYIRLTRDISAALVTMKHCAVCHMDWRGPYIDCPGCQAQAAMAALVPSEGADILLAELRLFAAECGDEWRRMMFLHRTEMRIAESSSNHEANTRRAELRAQWQAREALIRRVITVLESTL